MAKEQPNQPWWREPWPWILMAGPALAIVGCAVTIVLAVNSFRGEAIVNDGAVKRGLVVEKQADTRKNMAGDKQP